LERELEILRQEKSVIDLQLSEQSTKCYKLEDQLWNSEKEVQELS